VSAPVVTFLSDYGYEDEFVGVCHGVIAQRCPAARIIDVTHGIRAHDVRGGALALRAALPYMPAGVHLAVVDPGVGSERRAVALTTDDPRRFLVGPDNGLRMEAAALFGGAREAFDIGRSPEVLTPPAATFHGRDVFAPVAAALADGVAVQRLGELFPPADLVMLEMPRPRVEPGALIAHVLSIDGYGNLSTDAAPHLLLEAGVALGAAIFVVCAGGDAGGRFVRTFADAATGSLLCYEDGRGALALAVSSGSAATCLGVSVGDELTLRAL
jgi:hypothetical protein